MCLGQVSGQPASLASKAHHEAPSRQPASEAGSASAFGRSPTWSRAAIRNDAPRTEGECSGRDVKRMSEKQVWFITGAGRGMGVEIARAALAAGNAVVATGRNPEKVIAAVGAADDL